MTDKGWFIKSMEPNNLFWTLDPAVDGTWTKDIAKALLFARERDATHYFHQTFHQQVHADYIVAGVH